MVDIKQTKLGWRVTWDEEDYIGNEKNTQTQDFDTLEDVMDFVQEMLAVK